MRAFTLPSPVIYPHLFTKFDVLSLHGVAGNDNKDACDYTPANAASAVTVGATDIHDKKAYFSSTPPTFFLIQSKTKSHSHYTIY